MVHAHKVVGSSPSTATMDILTVHYNTPEMMECMIRSLNKHTACTIYVFDNSDEDPFVNTFSNVEVIDNTEGKYIDFDFWLAQFPNRFTVPKSNYASPKHCISIQKCFSLLPNGFILMDSDVLVKKDISALWDDTKAWVGEPSYEKHGDVWVMRLLPYMCYLNVPLLRKYDIDYFNSEWMWFLTDKNPNKWYDTGAWLFKDCMDKGMPGGVCKISEYIEHFAHGSHAFLNESLGDWLYDKRELWKT